MPLDEPSWWYAREAAWPAQLLAPAASLYGQITARRMARPPRFRSRHPVICVGNFTAGGTGKSPVTCYLGAVLQASGLTPVVLTRGYGGRLTGPHLIDPARDTASDTGDEPLLLAATMPVCIARDRAAGGRFLNDRPLGTVIVMDDGLQNPGLAKNLTIAVVDGQRGIGNGRVIPAGPLRAPLAAQLAHTDVIVINCGPGIGKGGSSASEPAHGLDATFRNLMFQGPILTATVAPASDIGWLNGANVVAYAGIANPARFFNLLERLGAKLCASMTFRDHQPISETAARDLLTLADREAAVLVTTEKDFVRLPQSIGAGHATSPQATLRSRSRTLPIQIVMPDDNEARLKSLLARAVAQRDQV